MQARSVAAVLVAFVGLGAVARSDLAEVPLTLLAPAYDTVTQASLRDLGTALESYAMFEDLDGVTAAELADWGWVPGETTAVTIQVDGDRFRAVAQDVRPGARAFEYTSVALDPAASGVSPAAVDLAVDPVAGVTIQPLTGL